MQSENKIWKKIVNIDGIGIIFVYLAVFISLSIACPNFLNFPISWWGYGRRSIRRLWALP